MYSFANKSSFGARAISGAYLLLVRPHVTAPGIADLWRKRR